MGEVARVVTVMSGFTGGPGYNNLHFFGDPVSPSTAQDAVEAVVEFWQAEALWLGGPLTFSVQPDVSILDEATGALLRIESTSPPAQGTTSGGGPYAAGVGAVVGWQTNAVHLTKRLRGRTFLTPLLGAQYEANGTITSAALTAMRAAATTLAAVANFGVYGRPVDGAGGEWAGCTGATIRDHVAWLSSRRD